MKLYKIYRSTINIKKPLQKIYDVTSMRSKLNKFKLSCNMQIKKNNIWVYQNIFKLISCKYYL